MLIFNSKIEKPKYLEDLLVGRKDVVNALEKNIITSVKSGHNIEHLLIGNRGCGKTHLIRVLYNRISINKIVTDKMHIAYMAEEEIGIDSFFSLSVRIIEALIRWSDKNEEKIELRSKIDILKEISASDREERVQEFLLSFLGKKQLLILVENVNEIFFGMKSKGQARFRDFIQRTDKINIIATSQALFTDIQNEDKPFHNFFHIIQLKRLNEAETKDLLHKMASIENEKKLLTHFSTSKGKGQILAIHFLSEGNHRLIALFFEFLKTDIKSNLTEPFLQTLDKLKPYYESFIRHLPPQQQKIIQYLAIKHQPQLGSIIAKECFLTPGGTSKQMNELMNKGFVDAHRIGRDNKYELTEPMMRYCIELTNNRDSIIGMFARFIAILYSDTEIINKYLTLKYQLNDNCNDDYTYKQEKELSIYKKASVDHTQDFQYIESAIEKINNKNTKSAIVKIMMDIHNTYSKCPISNENCECSRFLNKNSSENTIFKIFIAKLILYSFYEEAYNLVSYLNSNSNNNEENITAPIFFVKCLYKLKTPKKVINSYLNKLIDLDTDILTNKLLSVLYESQFIGNKQAIYELTKDERVLLEFINDKTTEVSLPKEMLDIRTEISITEKK